VISTALLLHSLGNKIVYLDRSAPVAFTTTDSLTSSPDTSSTEATSATGYHEELV
jgi:hypothetical protein